MDGRCGRCFMRAVLLLPACFHPNYDNVRCGTAAVLLLLLLEGVLVQR
jgi:hypothetical protein